MKKREQQGGEKKYGTLEIWKRARKSSVQNTGELTINAVARREKGKNVFIAKKQAIWKRVYGHVEIRGIFLTPRVSPLSTAVVLGVLVSASCIFLRI